jgi:uncharacterized protein (DUF433 family)
MVTQDSNVIVSAFTEEQVERLTAISVHQLRHWDRTGFYHPEFADENRRNPYSRVYSFKDLVSLQILRTLRNELKVSLQHLREVKDKLAHLGDDRWSKTILYVLNKKVVFHDGESDERREVVSGQFVLQIPLKVVKADMESAVRDIQKRDPKKIGTIERNRRVSHNAWVVGGTRIPVDAIMSFHKAGYGIEQIIQEYPDITRQDIMAAIEHGEKAAA